MGVAPRIRHRVRRRVARSGGPAGGVWRGAPGRGVAVRGRAEAGLASGSRTAWSTAAHSGVSRPRRSLDPSGRGERVRPRRRWWSSSPARVPSGSSTARAWRAVRARTSGAWSRAWSTRNSSNASPCSARTARGRSRTVVVTIRACTGEMTPSACARATAGNRGSIGPPVTSARGPEFFRRPDPSRRLSRGHAQGLDQQRRGRPGTECVVDLRRRQRRDQHMVETGQPPQLGLDQSGELEQVPPGQGGQTQRVQIVHDRAERSDDPFRRPAHLIVDHVFDSITSFDSFASKLSRSLSSKCRNVIEAGRRGARPRREPLAAKRAGATRDQTRKRICWHQTASNKRNRSKTHRCCALALASRAAGQTQDRATSRACSRSAGNGAV